MVEDVLAYVSELRLSREDIKVLKVRDAYSMHRVVYGLFENVRNTADEQSNESSGILWVYKGGDYQVRKILLLSTRKPHQSPQFGVVKTKAISSKFLEYDDYEFKVRVNPTKRNDLTRKIEAIKGRENIISWANKRSQESWGFAININSLQVQINPVQSFIKNDNTVTHGSAVLTGVLKVTNRENFLKSFIHGIGRAKAFGFGLLQIIPINITN